MHDFLLDIRETFLNDKRFSVLLKPVERLGGANDHAFEVIPMEERPRIFEEFQTLILDGVQSSPLFRSPDICYAARPNSLMIRADGRIGKCTVALADPMNNIGRLLPDGSVQIDNARLRPWLRGWKSEESLALGCPYADLLRDGTTASPTLPIQIERVSA